MSSDYSFDSLMRFLEYLGEKGLMNKNTVVARKAATNKMFGVLYEDERADVREVDIDDLASRFQNLEGQKYTPQSLQVYKSRVSSSVSDFLRYKENPANFRVEASNRPNVVRKSREANDKVNRTGDAPKPSQPQFAGSKPKTFDLPVPLRPDCMVQINGLPIDLTKAEAQKISAVVSAMASSVEE